MIQGIVYDRFMMVLGCVPNAQDISPDSFLIGIVIASVNLLIGLRLFPRPI